MLTIHEMTEMSEAIINKHETHETIIYKIDYIF